MSVEKTEVETFFGRCRCCLAYGYLKNMWVEHPFEGEVEVYGEMLVQCFALTWEHSEASMEQDQICEQCICRLRDASDFKKVVLDSQEELLQEIENENIVVKEEKLDEPEYLEEYKAVADQDPDDTTYSYTEFTMDTGDGDGDGEDGDGDDDGMNIVKDEVYEDVEYLEEEDGEAKNADDTDSSQLTDQSRIRKKRSLKPDLDGEEGKPKRKWPKKLPKSERQKTYKQYSEVDLRKCLEEVRNNDLTAGEASIKYDIPKKTICAKLRVDPNDVQIDNTTPSNKGIQLRKRPSVFKIKTEEAEIKKDRKKNNEEQTPKSSSKTEEVEIKTDCKKNNEEQENPDDQRFMYKHKANIKAILQNSNATIIKAYGRFSFLCNFCDFKAEMPLDLKQHNLKIHTNISDEDEIIKTKYVTDLNVKLDMTYLKCNLCKEPMNTLEHFTEHLSEAHSKLIYKDVKNYFIPFKFETDDLKCFMCDTSFKYFKLLSEHMTEHYRNFECSVCYRGFINKQSMYTHMYRHKTGVFKCGYCSKEFDSRPKRTGHERTVHKIPQGQFRKCAHCDQRFPSWDSVHEHEFKAHGVKKPTFTCEHCGITCNNQSGLTMHKNRHHLFKKPHECAYCEMRFCTKNELRYHTNTHTKTRDFSCNICGKTFGTRITFNAHKRTHLGLKKLMCDYCDRKFSQRTSFRTHMKNQHGEIV